METWRFVNFHLCYHYLTDSIFCFLRLFLFLFLLQLCMFLFYLYHSMLLVFMFFVIHRKLPVPSKLNYFLKKENYIYILLTFRDSYENLSSFENKYEIISITNIYQITNISGYHWSSIPGWAANSKPKWLKVSWDIFRHHKINIKVCHCYCELSYQRQGYRQPV